MAKKIVASLLMIVSVIAITISIGSMVNADDNQTATASDGKIIKVAYVESENFIKGIDRGAVGYAVDYLDAIGVKGNWTYEYVAGSWDDCMQWVEDGTVDMMCMVQHTEERGEKYIFSKEAMGTEYGLIYTRDDEDIYYHDYELMDGMSIAMMPNTVFDERLDELEGIYDISFDRRYYGTIKEVIAAMESSETTLAIIGSILGYDGAKVVGRDDAVPYYCIMSADNEELMTEFDEAHRLAVLDDPGLQARLYQKYYGESELSSLPLFTRAEHEFIEKTSGVTVRVLQSMHPLCYEKNGDMNGIYVDYLKLLSEKTGLTIDIEPHATADLENDLEHIIKENCLTLRSNRVLEYDGVDDTLICTETLIETSLAYVKRIDKFKDAKEHYVFAITEDMDYYLSDLLREYDSKCQIQCYAEPEDCMAAVANGKADIAIHDAYVVSYLLQKPRYADVLAQVSGDELTNGMCLITTEADAALVSIFNKAIEYISPEEKENIVTLELKTNAYKYTLEDFVYEYRTWLAVVAVVLLGGIVTYTLLNRKLTNLKVQKKEYDILQKKMQHDELTGVYNKQYFYEIAREMIDVSDRNMCIAMMDITNFKVFNEMYGIENGDKLLKYIASELKMIVRQYDGIVARFNADHFYICMEEEMFNEDNFPKRFKKTVVDNVDVSVTYGVYVVGAQKDVPVNIMCDRASMANHEKDNKSAGYIRYYTEEDRSRIVKQKEIENDMEEALEQRQFCVYVQPKYDIYKKEIIGGEALARWIHPEKGMISPGEFIPVFEKNGFIRYLDYYIWEETCRVLSDLKAKNAQNYPVSINVSRAHFYSNELKGKLLELLEKYKLEPQDLELEITETICAEDSGIINKQIKELQNEGFRIAMDDFGSGYSSLNMLKEIPLDIIKMDLRFLDSAENVEKSHKILGTLVDLAKSLELHVVVEGVETKEQVEFLEGLGGVCAQGFYFSRPVDSDTYEKMVISKVS